MKTLAWFVLWPAYFLLAAVTYALLAAERRLRPLTDALSKKGRGTMSDKETALPTPAGQLYRCDKVEEWTCPFCTQGLVPEPFDPIRCDPPGMVTCPQCNGNFHHKTVHLFAENAYVSGPIKVVSDCNGYFGKTRLEVGKRYELRAAENP